ncbi:MAG: hypothetical protein AB8B71_19865 [Paracoccaceae bacterium]
MDNLMSINGVGLNEAGSKDADLNDTGCLVFEPTPDSLRWAHAARAEAVQIASDPTKQRENLRHGGTWFVGVDALPSAGDGAISGVALKGPWDPYVPLNTALHPAQLSIMYPGYPKQDLDQSDANHRYRVSRCGAHMDGLLPVGPDKRRQAMEFHAYILGIQISDCAFAPTVYWPGSHHILQTALRRVLDGRDPKGVDVTDAYHMARRQVFATCDPVALPLAFGASFLLHRFALHGTAPWGKAASEGARMTAFFRPEFETAQHWLSGAV